jgi:hypothetical protein
VHLPTQASPQIHGWWVREDQYPPVTSQQYIVPERQQPSFPPAHP